MKKYVIFLLSLSAASGSLESSQNTSSVVDNKTPKSMITAVLITATAIPAYMYYRWSLTNQEEIQKITQEISNLKFDIAWYQNKIKNIENGTYLPLPKEYQERKKTAIEPHDVSVDNIDSQGNYDEFKKFIIKFTPPIDVQNNLIENEQRIHRKKSEYNDQQNRVFVKSQLDVNRIVNIERMKKLINQYQLKHIIVPNKYVFFIGDKFVNIADKILPYGSPNTLVSEDEVKELANFVKEIGYSDFTLHNIFKSSNGKWTFIDTEDGAFKSIPKIGPCRNAIANLKELKYYLLTYSTRIGVSGMTPEAQSWLDNKIKDLENSLTTNSDKQCTLSLIQRTDLDDKDINIEIVKKYADELNTQRILRSTVFGIDPFDQKYSKELIDQLKSDIGADQVKLNRLETKLVTLQKTWYARIRDSWSNFWSASRAKVASWRLW